MKRKPHVEDPAEFLRHVQRRFFLAFLDKAWPYISGGELIERNWHIDAIGYWLDRVTAGTCRRLLVNLPPRNAKSKTVSVIWVAWMLGLDPSLNFVCVSYSNELSAKLARDCRAIMQSSWYRELFPRTIISSRLASHDFETTANGGRLATSISGTLTGRGGDIIILDDVIKPEEANSEAVREAVNEWYRTTLASRLNNKATGAILCIMQRLHQYDLPGMLLEAGGWDHLSLPAIATEDELIHLPRGRVHTRRRGDVLHEAREPMEVLSELRAAMGSTAFEAQYQQAPVPMLGNVFKAWWLLDWPAGFDPAEGGEIIQSWDTAIKTGKENAFSVCVTALRRGRYLYVLDVWRGRVEFPELKHKVIGLARIHGATTLLIEDKASGEELIQTLRSEQHAGVPVPIPRTPASDKLSRAEGVSSMVEGGQLFLPREAHWLGEFKSELLAFPSGRFVDQVDAVTQLLEWLRQRLSYQPVPNAGPELMDEDGDGYEDSPESDGDPWGAY
ncbi:MAG TPA: phage terminase large subunit [Chthoniobacterales bacterium]|nr:phage terminase large subunit [Chthoniobacterales bacterium]